MLLEHDVDQLGTNKDFWWR